MTWLDFGPSVKLAWKLLTWLKGKSAWGGLPDDTVFEAPFFYRHWATTLVNNLETLVCIFPSPKLIWVLQSSQCSKICMAQYWGRRGAHLSENKGVESECKNVSRKFRSTQRQFSENICSEDDLRPRILRTFVAKFLVCLRLLGFLNI